jgi:hypothetical protein
VVLSENGKISNEKLFKFRQKIQEVEQERVFLKIKKFYFIIFNVFNLYFSFLNGLKFDQICLRYFPENERA